MEEHTRFEEYIVKCVRKTLGKRLKDIEKSKEIEKVDSDLHDILFGNILLIGGSTTTNRFKENLEKQIASVVSSSRSFSLMDMPKRLYLPWTGGSMTANLLSFKEVWVTYNGFTPKGAEVFERKI